MSYVGTTVTGRWVDEASSDHMVDAMRYSMEALKTSGFAAGAAPPLPLWPEIKPLEVPCSACGAEIGERCNRGRDLRTGRIRQRGLHFRRKDDARLATEATRALLTQR